MQLSRSIYQFYHPTFCRIFSWPICPALVIKQVTQKLESSAINFLFRPLYILQSFPKVLGTKVNDQVRCDLNQNGGIKSESVTNHRSKDSSILRCIAVKIHFKGDSIRRGGSYPGESFLLKHVIIIKITLMLHHTTAWFCNMQITCK